MSHGFMHGMIWASILLSGIPVAVMLAGGIWLFRRFREERGAAREP
ncbi:MAG TPA: hypothetical protein VMN78_08125 [Longimicrobiales bacterium]|nr:hypothetical protein [Longimicrobiales bacterium]